MDAEADGSHLEAESQTDNIPVIGLMLEDHKMKYLFKIIYEEEILTEGGRL